MHKHACGPPPWPALEHDERQEVVQVLVNKAAIDRAAEHVRAACDDHARARVMLWLYGAAATVTISVIDGATGVVAIPVFLAIHIINTLSARDLRRRFGRE